VKEEVNQPAELRPPAEVRAQTTSVALRELARVKIEDLKFADAYSEQVVKADPRVLTMISQALKAQENAHAPQSGYKVGAAVLSKPHQGIYAGCNFEYSKEHAIHAEEAAVSNANSSTLGKLALEKVVVVTDSEVPAMCCGNCRDILVEAAASPNMPVISVTSKGHVKALPLSKLMPNSFLRVDLERLGPDRALVDEAISKLPGPDAFSPTIPVGAAIQTEDGESFSACAVGDVAFHAQEAFTLARNIAISEANLGIVPISKIAIAGKGGVPVPSGKERQMMLDNASLTGLDPVVYLVSVKSDEVVVRKTSVRQLLPEAFGAGDILSAKG